MLPSGAGQRLAVLGVALACLQQRGIQPAFAQANGPSHEFPDVSLPGPRIEVGQGEAGVQKTAADGSVNSLDTRGISASTADGMVQFRLSGKIEADFGATRLREGRLGKPYDDSSDYRRTFLETYPTNDKTYAFAFQYDFADNTRPINDAVFAYRGFDPFRISVGNFKEPFSFSLLVSDSNTMLTERSLADAFAPSRNVGLAIGTHGTDWTLVGGVFGGNANTGVADQGVAGTARLTYAPILRADEVLHLAVAGSYRSLDRGETASFSSRPASFLFRTALVNTSAIKDSSAIERVGREFAYQNGPIRTESEYNWTRVDRYGRAKAVSFHGGYVQAAYTIDGNGRPCGLVAPYGTSYAVFGAPQADPARSILQGGIGVFELTARVSYLDLQDRDVMGGREFDYSLVINWYPQQNVKFAADYVKAKVSDSPVGSRHHSADIFIGRVQLYW